jgi:hypothetical protein
MEAELLSIKSTMGLYSGTQSNAANSSSKTATNKASGHTDLDQSTRLERNSSEDTVMVTDNHLHRAQASILYYIKAVLEGNDTTIIERTSPRKPTLLLRLRVCVTASCSQTPFVTFHDLCLNVQHRRCENPFKWFLYKQYPCAVGLVC